MREMLREVRCESREMLCVSFMIPLRPTPSPPSRPPPWSTLQLTHRPAAAIAKERPRARLEGGRCAGWKSCGNSGDCRSLFAQIRPLCSRFCWRHERSGKRQGGLKQRSAPRRLGGPGERAEVSGSRDQEQRDAAEHKGGERGAIDHVDIFGPSYLWPFLVRSIFLEILPQRARQVRPRVERILYLSPRPAGPRKILQIKKKKP